MNPHEAFWFTLSRVTTILPMDTSIKLHGDPSTRNFCRFANSFTININRQKFRLRELSAQKLTYDKYSERCLEIFCLKYKRQLYAPQHCFARWQTQEFSKCLSRVSAIHFCTPRIPYIPRGFFLPVCSPRNPEFP